MKRNEIPTKKNKNELDLKDDYDIHSFNPPIGKSYIINDNENSKSNLKIVQIELPENKNFQEIDMNKQSNLYEQQNRKNNISFGTVTNINENLNESQNFSNQKINLDYNLMESINRNKLDLVNTSIVEEISDSDNLEKYFNQIVSKQISLEQLPSDISAFPTDSFLNKDSNYLSKIILTIRRSIVRLFKIQNLFSQNNEIDKLNQLIDTHSKLLNEIMDYANILDSKQQFYIEKLLLYSQHLRQKDLLLVKNGKREEFEVRKLRRLLEASRNRFNQITNILESKIIELNKNDGYLNNLGKADTLKILLDILQESKNESNENQQLLIRKYDDSSTVNKRYNKFELENSIAILDSNAIISKDFDEKLIKIIQNKLIREDNFENFIRNSLNNVDPISEIVQSSVNNSTPNSMNKELMECKIVQTDEGLLQFLDEVIRDSVILQHDFSCQTDQFITLREKEDVEINLISENKNIDQSTNSFVNSNDDLIHEQISTNSKNYYLNQEQNSSKNIQNDNQKETKNSLEQYNELSSKNIDPISITKNNGLRKSSVNKIVNTKNSKKIKKNEKKIESEDENNSILKLNENQKNIKLLDVWERDELNSNKINKEKKDYNKNKQENKFDSNQDNNIIQIDILSIPKEVTKNRIRISQNSINNKLHANTLQDLISQIAQEESQSGISNDNTSSPKELIINNNEIKNKIDSISRNQSNTSLFELYGEENQEIFSSWSDDHARLALLEQDEEDTHRSISSFSNQSNHSKKQVKQGYDPKKTQFSELQLQRLIEKLIYDVQDGPKKKEEKSLIILEGLYNRISSILHNQNQKKMDNSHSKKTKSKTDSKIDLNIDSKKEFNYDKTNTKLDSNIDFNTYSLIKSKRRQSHNDISIPIVPFTSKNLSLNLPTDSNNRIDQQSDKNPQEWNHHMNVTKSSIKTEESLLKEKESSQKNLSNLNKKKGHLTIQNISPPKSEFILKKEGNRRKSSKIYVSHSKNNAITKQEENISIDSSNLLSAISTFNHIDKEYNFILNRNEFNENYDNYKKSEENDASRTRKEIILTDFPKVHIDSGILYDKTSTISQQISSSDEFHESHISQKSNPSNLSKQSHRKNSVDFVASQRRMSTSKPAKNDILKQDVQKRPKYNYISQNPSNNENSISLWNLPIIETDNGISSSLSPRQKNSKERSKIQFVHSPSDELKEFDENSFTTNDISQLELIPTTYPPILDDFNPKLPFRSPRKASQSFSESKSQIDSFQSPKHTISSTFSPFSPVLSSNIDSSRKFMKDNYQKNHEKSPSISEANSNIEYTIHTYNFEDNSKYSSTLQSKGMHVSQISKNDSDTIDNNTLMRKKFMQFSGKEKQFLQYYKHQRNTPSFKISNKLPSINEMQDY